MKACTRTEPLQAIDDGVGKGTEEGEEEDSRQEDGENVVARPKGWPDGDGDVLTNISYITEPQQTNALHPLRFSLVAAHGRRQLRHRRFPLLLVEQHNNNHVMDSLMNFPQTTC